MDAYGDSGMGITRSRPQKRRITPKKPDKPDTTNEPDILLFALSGAGFATSNEGGKHHHEGGKQKPAHVTQPAKPASPSASSSAAASAGAIGVGVGVGVGGQGGNGGQGGSGGLGGQGGTGGSAAGGTAIASVGAMNLEPLKNATNSANRWRCCGRHFRPLSTSMKNAAMPTTG